MSELSVDAIIRKLQQDQKLSKEYTRKLPRRNSKEICERRSQTVRIGQVVSKVLQQIEDEHLRAKYRKPLLEKAQQLACKGKRLSTASLLRQLSLLRASETALA
ncbi:MAG: hypothetical protein JJU20_13765 [Opitutales bacterium]|nr:hypothetical protein [Opitutales bacterium]